MAVIGAALLAQPALKLSARSRKNLAIATRELKDMLQYTAPGNRQ